MQIAATDPTEPGRHKNLVGLQVRVWRRNLVDPNVPCSVKPRCTHSLNSPLLQAALDEQLSPVDDELLTGYEARLFAR